MGALGNTSDRATVWAGKSPSEQLRESRPESDPENLEARLFHHPLSRIYAALTVCRRLARLGPLLEARHDDPELTLLSAARACAINSGYLNRRLRMLTGWTFHQLLIRRRLLRAAELLETTDLEIPIVAHRSGFGCVRTLHRNFVDLLGESPIRYRRRRIRQRALARCRGTEGE